MKKYYFQKEGTINEIYREYEGPLNEFEIKENIKKDLIKPNTRIWNKEICSWTEARFIEEFKNCFEAPPLQKKDENSTDILSKINETLKRNEESQEKVLKQNEERHDKILEKHNEIIARQASIHSRQIKLVIIAISLFLAFFVVSAIYLKVMVADSKENNDRILEESKKQERVKLTIEKFEEMWTWYYLVLDTDSLFKKFAFRDTILYESDSAKLTINQNINRFYNYFEIFKSMDQSNMLDKATAENLFPFFRNVGRRIPDDSLFWHSIHNITRQDSCYFIFNYIDSKRTYTHNRVEAISKLKHLPNNNCTCGRILDGYAYIFNKYLQTNVPPTKYHDLESDH